MEEISIYELRRIDLKDAIVIDGFPSIGLVSSIVANYLVNAFELEQIGILDSVHFPPISLIRHSEPLSTVRIYSQEKSWNKREVQLVVFISEFQPPQSLVKMIASTMLDWIIDQKCKMLISPEGLIIEGKGEEGEEKESEAYGVASTKNARELLEQNGIKIFTEGVITGLAGVLLSEGKKRDFDVISILAEAHQQYPDARAAAKALEVIDKISLHMRLDPRPLYKEAEIIEAQIKAIQKQAKAVKQVPTPDMYG
ncbi:MAG: PAC2 family protein [Candidatus Thermoplasmatota archaeon]